MGWERRQRGGAYFYQSVRVGGRPRKLYLGAGPEAEAHARREDERRQRRAAERAALEEERARLAAAEAALREAEALAGDRAALADLRHYLDNHPEVWQTCGNLARVAERTWLELFAAGALSSEVIRRHVEQLRADLAGAQPTPMERALVDLVIGCYL